MSASLTRRSAITLMGAGLVAAFSGIAVASLTDTVEGEHTVAEIMRLRSQLEPMQRLFFDQQCYALHQGEPNIFNGTADYTYEEWLAGYEPWEISLIEKA